MLKQQIKTILNLKEKENKAQQLIKMTKNDNYQSCLE